jgi:hypothetical protein
VLPPRGALSGQKRVSHAAARIHGERRPVGHAARVFSPLMCYSPRVLG